MNIDKSKPFDIEKSGNQNMNDDYMDKAIDDKKDEPASTKTPVAVFGFNSG